MSRRTPWREARLVAVDLETTGLDPRRDQVISFAAVPIEKGRIVAGEAVYGLVRPDRDVPGASIEIHGIRAQDLAGAPPAAVALGRLADAMRGRDLIAHAAWVERSFLVRPLRRHGVRIPRTPLDTAELWRFLCIERERRDPGFRASAPWPRRSGCPSTTPTTRRATP